MRYRDIFIDFDDTIYDTRGNAQVALEQIFDEFGLKEHFPEPQTFYDSYWRTNTILWRQYAHGEIEKAFLMVERFRLPLSEGMPEVTEEYCSGVSDRFLEICSAMPGTIPGAHKMLSDLKAMGYRLHIASNGFRKEQYKKLRASEVLEFFDTIILSEDAGVNKPLKAFFEYALREAGAEADTSLMIGDNYDTDILGAMGAGIHAMLYNRWDPDFVPPQMPDYVVARLEEIAPVLSEEFRV